MALLLVEELVEELVALAGPQQLVFDPVANLKEHLQQYRNDVLAVRVADSFPELWWLAAVVRLPVAAPVLVVVVLAAAAAAHLPAFVLLLELRLDL